MLNPFPGPEGSRAARPNFCRDLDGKRYFVTIRTTRTTPTHLLAGDALAILVTAIFGLCGSISIRFSR
jgi:hypothetical protein